MKEYKLCDIDFEVGDIVSTRNDEEHQPYKVLAITPRIVDDSEDGRLHKLVYNLKNGDVINPAVTVKSFVIGGERESLREINGGGWDAEHFVKIDIEDLQRWIDWKEEDIANDFVKMIRLKKTKELIEESLLENK
jgi:hypothetical protein